jgi:type I restriction enzyme S subunit
LKGRVGWKGLTSDEYLESGYAYLVTGTDFSKKFISWQDCYCVEQARYEDDPFIQLREGDLLITKDGTIGKLALVSGLDRPACLNSGIFLVRPERDYVTEYMYWVLQSEAFKVFCDLSSMGSTIQHLYQNVFDDFAFPAPELREQRSIATFLDREVAKIDALIDEQERLVSVLVEKRRATISHVVTKGLDSDALMKDSNVTWMGAVPAHWHIAKLGLYATVENGTTPSRAAPEYWDGGDIPWLASGEVNQLKISEASEFITAAALKSCSLRLLPAGTVVVGMIGQGKTRGMSAILSIPATINQNLAAICPGSSIEGMYILYLLHAVYEWLREAGRGGNQAAMNCEILAALRIPLPPLTEQKMIVDFIEVEAAKLDSLKSRAEHAIALLKERRGALITAAVTGQIDVRCAISQTIVESPEAIAA